MMYVTEMQDESGNCHYYPDESSRFIDNRMPQEPHPKSYDRRDRDTSMMMLRECGGVRW
jgi:hypothetical protein